MIIKVLSENTSISEDMKSEHGLSLYIETKDHKLLFDTGASALFAENSIKMNVDLRSVDLTVISHGHYDHGGGLGRFININQKSKIFINERSFEKHYSIGPDGKKTDIGLDETLLPNTRFTFIGDHFAIGEKIELFSGVPGKKFVPSCNKGLLIKTGDAFLNDDFAHEQNLTITEDGKTLLVVGCAHCGIIDIIDHFREKRGCLPDHVIGGFHMHSRLGNYDEDPAVVDKIGRYLINTKASYHTCHCTGILSYEHLKAILGEKIDYLSAGCQLKI